MTLCSGTCAGFGLPHTPETRLFFDNGPPRPRCAAAGETARNATANPAQPAAPGRPGTGLGDHPQMGGQAAQRDS